jgi:hypothetical protein
VRKNLLRATLDPTVPSENMTLKAALPLDSKTYVRHPLHGDQNVWIEKNCYVDVWIEAIHAMGLDPMPVFAPAIAADFEGDQWTFFKPSHADLEALYGIDVQELQIWRPLLEHVQTQLPEKKLVFTEADSFFLPDTRGTDYRTNHVKTTISIATLDVEAQKLGYFHNTSFHTLEGADFAGIFRIGLPHDPAFLPLYCEFARVGRVTGRATPELAAISVERLRSALRRRPATNPMARFKERFPLDVAWLCAEGLPLYHGYAFANLRQCGVSFDLASQHLAWLAKHGDTGTQDAAVAFDEVSQTCKALVLKLARAVNTRRSMDFASLFDGMEAAWARGMELAGSRLGV